MTKTQQLIDLLAGKRSNSVEDLERLTGWPIQAVRNTIVALTMRGCMEAEPVRYSLTDKGARRVGKRSLTREQRNAQTLVRKSKQRREARIAKADHILAASLTDELARKIRGNAPNSVFSMGLRG